MESQLATHGESVEWADLAEIGPLDAVLSILLAFAGFRGLGFREV